MIYPLASIPLWFDSFWVSCENSHTPILFLQSLAVESNPHHPSQYKNKKGTLSVFLKLPKHLSSTPKCAMSLRPVCFHSRCSLPNWSYGLLTELHSWWEWKAAKIKAPAKLPRRDWPKKRIMRLIKRLRITSPLQLRPWPPRSTGLDSLWQQDRCAFLTALKEMAIPSW